MNSLAGLVDGLRIDSRIGPAEIGFSEMLLADHTDRDGVDPFDELIPVMRAALVS